MAFSRKRGRPKSQSAKNDYGTPQLQAKRSIGLTSEPLDLCLNKKLISTDEHEAGIRLRWLYTLRFGSPNISAYRLEPLTSSSCRNDDEDWLNAKGTEYEGAIRELTKIGAKRTVMNICIFNQRSSFLLPYTESITKAQINKRRIQFELFKDGMDILTNVFGKNY